MSDNATAMKRLVESDNTTAIQRLLDVSNALWDTMYVVGDVPTYGERYWFFRAMKDAMDENAKLRKLLKDLYEDMWAGGEWLEPYEQRMRELGIEVK